jgi:hypothetical protein
MVYFATPILASLIVENVTLLVPLETPLEGL